jgi:cytoskeletal protein CcmA (bactofilin family)
MFNGKKPEETPGSSDRAMMPDAHQKADPKVEARTHIGPGTTIRGEVQIEGEAVVYGTVEGQLAATGGVEVMKGGSVKADVRGKSVRVMGRVEGKIVAGDRVQLLSGAHVRGDIHSQSLKIEEGVFFQGACVMGENPLAAEQGKILAMPADAAHGKTAHQAGG